MMPITTSNSTSVNPAGDGRVLVLMTTSVARVRALGGNSRHSLHVLSRSPGHNCLLQAFAARPARPRTPVGDDRRPRRARSRSPARRFTSYEPNAPSFSCVTYLARRRSASAAPSANAPSDAGSGTLTAVNESNENVAGVEPSGPPNAYTPTRNIPSSMLGPPLGPWPGPVTTLSNVKPGPPTCVNVAPL